MFEKAKRAGYVVMVLDTSLRFSSLELSSVKRSWNEGGAVAFERRKEKTFFSEAPSGEAHFPGLRKARILAHLGFGVKSVKIHTPLNLIIIDNRSHMEAT